VLSTQLLFWDWGGFKMGTPHLQTGMSLKRGGVKKIKDILSRCHYTSAFDLTDSKLSLIEEKITQKHLEYLFGYASSIYVIAEYLSRHKKRIPLKRIFTWGDCLFPNYRDKIESVFACKVQDCYGLGEGLQVAAQCERTGLLHIAQHNVIVEVTDETGQKDLPFNQLGKVLVTRLTPGPMPLVRYDTGDLAALSSGSCDCGRNLQLISRVHGRDTDVIRSPLNDRLIVHFFTQIFEMIPQILQFQVRQSKLEEIDIYYVPAANFHKNILLEIRGQIDDNTHYKFIINFHEVQNIPLQKSNKRRFVISSLPFEAKGD
jgi:phenylacetate-CoA ligase